MGKPNQPPQAAGLFCFDPQRIQSVLGLASLISRADSYAHKDRAPLLDPNGLFCPVIGEAGETNPINTGGFSPSPYCWGLLLSGRSCSPGPAPLTDARMCLGLPRLALAALGDLLAGTEASAKGSVELGGSNIWAKVRSLLSALEGAWEHMEITHACSLGSAQDIHISCAILCLA